MHHLVNPEQAGARAVTQACAIAQIPGAEAAEAVRLAENQTWRLPGQVIVRLCAAGQLTAARREVTVARWLADNGIPTIRPLDVHQPVVVDGRPVTFWEELPTHQPSANTDVAALLRKLHTLPAPSFLAPLAPFVRVTERLDVATTIDDGDRRWLYGLHTELQAAWLELPAGAPHSAVHGDARSGNIVRTTTGQHVMMDLERFSVGPPEWDLVSTAIGHTTLVSVTAADYTAFCTAYGTDVTQWPGYPTLAAIRELRMVTYAAQHAAYHPSWAEQAQYRIDCLRGRCGPRPWPWTGIL